MRRGDQGPLPLRRECTAVVCRKRQPLCDLGEVTGTGKAPAEQLAVPWRRQTTLPDGCPTGPKRPDSRDGRPNPRPRRLTKSEGQETLGAETRRDRDEGDGATTGDREDTPSTPRLEPPDPDGSMNDGGKAGGTTVPGSRQEGGEPAKKER